MLGRLNHVAIVVPDLAAAARHYADLLGAEVSDPVDLPEQGVTTIFVSLANSKVELLHPLGADSPVAGFLARHPEGGMHHLCYEVADLTAERARLAASGVRIVSESPRGAHGKPVLFLHPKDCHGTLIELEQA